MLIYREGDLEMILKTKEVVVGHVFDREVQKLSPRDDDGWVVNYIKHTDHIIDKKTQTKGVVTPLPRGHCCQDIEVYACFDLDLHTSHIHCR